MARETCKKCGDPIGRGSILEPSVFIEIEGEVIGPVCEECEQYDGSNSDDRATLVG